MGVKSFQEGISPEGKEARGVDDINENGKISSGFEGRVGSENNLLIDDELNSRHIDDVKSAQLNGYTNLEERLQTFSHTQNGSSSITNVSLFKLISYRYHKSRNKLLNGNSKPVRQVQKIKLK